MGLLVFVFRYLFVVGLLLHVEQVFAESIRGRVVGVSDGEVSCFSVNVRNRWVSAVEACPATDRPRTTTSIWLIQSN